MGRDSGRRELPTVPKDLEGVLMFTPIRSASLSDEDKK